MREHIINQSIEYQKCYSLRALAAFKTNYFRVIEGIGFWIKREYKCNKTLKIFSSKNISRKYQKVQFCIQWLYICDKIYLIKATSRNLSMQISSEIRVLITDLTYITYRPKLCYFRIRKNS